MEKKYISPQVKIAASVYFRGGKADTGEISQDIDYTHHQIRSIGRHLINRSILRKLTRRRKNGTYMFSIWTLRHQKIKKVEQMIRDAWGEEALKNGEILKDER